MLLPGILLSAILRIGEPTGITVQLLSDCSFTISTREGRTFGGTMGGTSSKRDVRTSSGKDAIGKYDELEFASTPNGGRRNSIRTYADRPIVVFESTTESTAPNTPFLRLSAYPALPYHNAFRDGDFGHYTFDLDNAHDSPWLFFDSDDFGFILSPASQFMVASSTRNADGTIETGIENAIETLPAGTSYRAMLIVGSGINHLFTTWGNALTALSGKHRATNEADVTLQKLGYWTDNGATYYYHYDRSKGYEGTLLAIRDEFARLGAPLGYMQVDSWWYGKGPKNSWKSRGDGIYEYRASPELFSNGLGAFSSELGLRLVVHARWIDRNSPYRRMYTISGNVAIDPRYWDDAMRYLRENGVVTYEQDWLYNNAQATTNLTDPFAFHDLMAAAATNKGMTLQYCMPNPRDYLQGSRYSALTTMRVADDRFGRNRWDAFAYGSRLVTALGAWPWADVFTSSETKNILIATLSGGPVGPGDALGTENAANLLASVRGDGVIVKPDTPFVPIDQSVIAEARDPDAPMIAAASTNHDDTLTDYYVFAYSRTTNGSAIRFRPSRLSDETMPTGRAWYVYDYFAGRGRVVAARDSFHDTVPYDGTYYVVAPVGRSGMAFLGDLAQFVPLGRNRIASLNDRGAIEVTELLARGEAARTISVYAPTGPRVSVHDGTLRSLRYDRTTQIGRIEITPGSSRRVGIRISMDGKVPVSP